MIVVDFIIRLGTPFSIRELTDYWPIPVEGMLVSLALGLIGCFLVVRGMSLLGDALSHSVLPGIVIGFLIGGSLSSPWILIGATAVGTLAAVLVQTVQSNSRIKEDASLGIVFTTLFALGVAMINLFAGQADLDPGCVLYGNIEYFIIRRSHIWPMAGVLVLIVLGLLLFYRHLLVSTFDPGLAISLGIPATAIHYAMMGVLSLTVVASFEAVGAILAVALLILPGATARLWTDRMPSMLLLAAAHGIISTIIGYWLSHPAIANTSASGAICVVGFVLFLGSWLLSPRYGLITRWRARVSLSRMMAAENLLKAIEELAISGKPVREAELASNLQMNRGTFPPTLARALAQGWATQSGGDIALTEAGRKQSNRLTRAHELWERYLHQEVGLEADHVHDAAEWIEHYLDDESVQRLDELLRQDAATRSPLPPSPSGRGPG